MEKYMTFKEEMKERTEVIEKLLVKYLPKAEGYQSQIMEAMEYSVMAGGKRLRPMLRQRISYTGKQWEFLPGMHF